MTDKQTVDELILNNPRIQIALDRGIDDLEAGYVFSREESKVIIEKKTEKWINTNRRLK